MIYFYINVTVLARKRAVLEFFLLNKNILKITLTKIGKMNRINQLGAVFAKWSQARGNTSYQDLVFINLSDGKIENGFRYKVV